jgi:hypothetical protein
MPYIYIGVRDCPYGICCPWVRGGGGLDALVKFFGRRRRRRRRRPRPLGSSSASTNSSSSNSSNTNFSLTRHIKRYNSNISLKRH